MKNEEAQNHWSFAFQNRIKNPFSIRYFSGSGLPANEMAGQILKQAKVRGEKEQFVVVFAAVGITHREASYFTKCFRETESSSLSNIAC